MINEALCATVVLQAAALYVLAHGKKHKVHQVVHHTQDLGSTAICDVCGTHVAKHSTNKRGQVVCENCK